MMMIQAALLIFALRLVDVTAMTLRILMVMRGRKIMAWVLGFFQALVFVVAIREVFADLGNWLNIVGYAAGFGSRNTNGCGLVELVRQAYKEESVDKGNG